MVRITDRIVPPPIVFTGKKGNIEVHTQPLDGEDQWVIKMVRSTLGDKWIAVFTDQTMALEYSAWLAKRI